jgi:diaminopimelate decarboxylase
MLTYSEIWKKILKSEEISEEDEAIQFYSIKNLKQRLKHLSGIFSPFDALHTIAIKTNPHPHILKKISEWGYGLEAASLQEVILAANTGIDAGKIIFNSPVKTQREIKYVSTEFPGLKLNANSVDELKRIPLNHRLTLGLRINPVNSDETDDLYEVSGENSKFGEPVRNREKILEAVKKYDISHLHVHSGSRNQNFKKSLTGLKKVTKLSQFINDKLGKAINTINIGGGLAAGENNEQSLVWMKNYVNQIVEECPELCKEFKLITEFGQWVHQHQGLFFSKVEYVNRFENKSVAYLHVGADMFVRHVYSKSNHINILCLDKKGDLKSGNKRTFDIAGPLCFNGDYLSKNIKLPHLDEGDIIAMYPCGANTYGLWSRHCSRDIPALITDQIDTDTFIKVSKRWNPFLDKSLWNNA